MWMKYQEKIILLEFLGSLIEAADSIILLLTYSLFVCIFNQFLSKLFDDSGCTSETHFLKRTARKVSYTITRMLVNVCWHMMFRPELIYIFELIVNQLT